MSAQTDARLRIAAVCFLIGIAALVMLFTPGCDRSRDSITVNVPTAPTAPKVETNTIEFRAIGNANAVRIRHINPVDGLSQVSTVLPYIVSLKTEQATMFLSLEVTPLSYPAALLAPFLSAQIFVNGTLFREGSSADLLLLPISVSGTWRK
jgi:hypothetical protein